MNKKQVQELIDLVIENQLTAIELEEKDTRIRIEKAGSDIVTQVMPQQTSGTVEPVATESTTTAEVNTGFEVKSPLVGVFYDANGPEEAAFVSVGSKVKEGDTLCIIESMKVMNEISTPKSGVIKKILVKKGDLVQFEEPLFIIE